MILATIQPICADDQTIAMCNGVIENNSGKIDWIMEKIYATTKCVRLGHSEKFVSIGNKHLCFVFHPTRDASNRMRPATIVWDANTSEEEIKKTFNQLGISFSRYQELKKDAQKQQNKKKILILGSIFIFAIVIFFIVK